MSLSRAEIEEDIEGLEAAQCPDKTSFQTRWGEAAIGAGACPPTDSVQEAPTLVFAGEEGKKYTCICSDRACLLSVPSARMSLSLPL